MWNTQASVFQPPGHDPLEDCELSSVDYNSVQINHVQLFVTPWTAACQASLSITNSGACSNSCPLCRWYHPTISTSVAPFSPHLQSFPASGSFSVSQLFESGGQSIGASAFSISPSNEYSGLISFRIDWSDLLAVLYFPSKTYVYK